MRKQYCYLSLLGIALLFSCATYGQQYTLTPSVGNFVPLVGGTPLDVIETNEALSPNINIGFTFNYFGQPYSQVRVSSQGYLGFDQFFGTGSNVMGQDGVMRKIIAPLWDILSGVGGQASYLVSGSEFNRVFTMEWLNWRWNFGSGPAISFQVQLHESTGEIKFVYRQELEAVSSPSASIGIVGQSTSQFYSLTFTSDPANPQLAPVGYNAISEKPSTGQTYTFAPSLIEPVTPVGQATNIVLNQLTANSMAVGWTIGTGTYRAVFVKQTSDPENFSAGDNQFFQPNSVFGSMSTSAGNGWYCVYNGTGSSVSITGLHSGMPYRIQVVEYNGLANRQKYLLTTGAQNPISGSTLLIRPTASSSIVLNLVSETTVLFATSGGSGGSRTIFMKATSQDQDNVTLVDQVTYTDNSIFGNGSEISSGWFCVIKGNSTGQFLVTNLQPNTIYKMLVFDYNGSPGAELYSTSPSTISFNTYSDLSVNYSFDASIGEFVELVGATLVPSIENDDILGPSKIPVGFTFYLKGIPFQELTASSNGFLSFNPYIDDSYLTNSLANGHARPLIAPLWDDIDGEAGQASYLTTGTTPNRVFTFEYLRWQWSYIAEANISFQIKLYESDNKIQFIYRQEDGDLMAHGASIGIAFPEFNEFLSLDNSSASPSMLSVETSTIDTKPQTGQIYSFTPTKLDQTINFGAVTSGSVGNSAQLTASSTSDLPVSYTSSDPAVASVSGNTVTFVGVGQTTISANQSGNSLFNAATQVQQLLTVVKGDQTISFPAIASKKYGDAAFTLNTSASSGLTIFYESSNPAVATVNNNQVTVVGVGSTTITAKQSGNANYNPAADVSQILTVQKADQQITFASLSEKILGDAPFQIAATSNVGLPVSFTTSNASIATVSGNTITIVGHGIVTITASQPGNANYNAATSVEQNLKVRANQTITFAEIPTKKIGDANFTLTPMASSGFAVQLSTSSDKIALANGVVSIVSPGSVTITANQPGDDIFFAAPSVSRTFCINPVKPSISVTGLGSETPVLQSSAPSNNQWFKDGAAMAGQTSNSLTVTGPGMYSLKVIVDGCSSEPSDTESLIITGISSEQEEVRIFPNPAHDRITVDVNALNLGFEVPVAIIDLTGREVLRSAVQKSVDLDIAKLRAGNYQILIKHGSKAISKEFVKH